MDNTEGGEYQLLREKATTPLNDEKDDLKMQRMYDLMTPNARMKQREQKLSTFETLNVHLYLHRKLKERRSEIKPQIQALISQ